MKCRWLLCLCMTFLLVIGSQRAFAQTEAITNSWKEELDPSSHKNDISARMQAALTTLANPASSASARNWFRDSAGTVDPTRTSPAYRLMFGDLLNQKLVALLSDAKTLPRTRVNVAIVTALVADRVHNAVLLPTVLKLLTDKSNAVALWGEKAASSLMPEMVSNAAVPPADLEKLLSAMQKSVADHNEPPVAGDIAQEAYLGINPASGLSLRNVVPTPVAAQSLVKCNLDLQQSRLALYKTSAPDSPDADTYPSGYLLSKECWATLKDEDRHRALQQAVNLISFACVRAQRKSVSGDTQEFVQTIIHESYYLSDLSTNQFKNATLYAAIQKVHAISLGTRPDDIEAARKDLFQAIHDAADSVPILAQIQSPDAVTPAP